MVVIDASAILELLLRTPAASQIEKRILSFDGNLHAPELLDLEVLHVLRRYCASHEVLPERAKEALLDLEDLGIIRYSHRPFLDRLWQLRHNMTAYDAAYLALAEFLAAPLLTTDLRLASTPGHNVSIVPLDPNESGALAD